MGPSCWCWQAAELVRLPLLKWASHALKVCTLPAILLLLTVLVPLYSHSEKRAAKKTQRRCKEDCTSGDPNFMAIHASGNYTSGETAGDVWKVTCNLEETNMQDFESFHQAHENQTEAQVGLLGSKGWFKVTILDPSALLPFDNIGWITGHGIALPNRSETMMNITLS